MVAFRCAQCDSTEPPSVDDGRILSPMVCDRCSGRAPLSPVPSFGAGLRKIRFRLITWFSITALLCVLFTSIRLFGSTGAAVFLDLVVLSIGIANLYRFRGALGIRIPRFTIAEFLVSMAICLMLHGLLTPAVQSNCHRRGTTIAPAAANFGASARDDVAPAENSAMSRPLGSAISASSTTTSVSCHGRVVPAERADAK